MTDLPDGGLDLEFTSTSRPEVVSWILSFGADARLVAPFDLRDDLQSVLASARELYQ